MFFDKKPGGFANQIPAVNMVNQGYGPEQQYTPDGMHHHQMGLEPMGMEPMGMGMGMEPMGCCEPCCEYPELEVKNPCPEIYVVQQGDTVYKIAQKYDLDWRELAGYNHLGNPDLIYPGERLFIPPR